MTLRSLYRRIPSRYLADWMRAAQQASSRPSMLTHLLSSEVPSSYYSTAGNQHITSAGRIASEP
jgi:hypothetical protein